jgi:hypothetical protein
MISLLIDDLGWPCTTNICKNSHGWRGLGISGNISQKYARSYQWNMCTISLFVVTYHRDTGNTDVKDFECKCSQEYSLQSI